MNATPLYLGCLFLAFLVMALNVQKCVTLALPLTKRDVGAGSLEVPPPEIMRFMRRFGYLEPNTSGDSEALYHESAIVEAIKNIQKYGALNQTGQLDNETLELFSKPRCGVPDIEGLPYYLSNSPRSSTAAENGRGRAKRFVIGARTWTKRRIEYFIANWSLKIPGQQVERDIARAFALWARYSGLRFTRINDTSADIIVGFGSRYHGDNFPFDGSGNILAHAYYPYEMGSWGGDVHFDEDENWKENSKDLGQGVDFYSVAVHEVGHALGLAHSPIHTSIMFPYYKGPEYNALDYDDTLAMYEMYLTKKLEDDNVDENEDIKSSDDFMSVESATEAQPRSTTDEISQTEAMTTPTYQGDYSTITEHKQNLNGFSTMPSDDDEVDKSTLTSSSTTLRPMRSAVRSNTKPELSQMPHICEGNFDAVTVLNGSVHIFKREYVWKLTAHYTAMRGYPRSIYEMFPFLPPAEVKHIDAAYVRQDGAGVFFTGRSYWIFNGGEAIEGSPLTLKDLIGGDKTAAAVDQVNAAMLWPKNNFTYIFAGAKFWRFNDGLHTLDAGYPKSIKRWPGIPENIDAAATLTNGKTYFFKDNLYWLYNNPQVRPERGYPRRASTAWLGCATPTKTPLRNYNTTVAFISS